LKILIVDDSRMDRKLLSSSLKRSGVTNEILEAVNGEDGFDVLSKNYNDICLILLDWQMPQMDGIDFMKGIVNVPTVAAIPIIMITASGAEENKKLARDVNPNLAGYIVKPYSVEILIETITPFLK